MSTSSEQSTILPLGVTSKQPDAPDPQPSGTDLVSLTDGREAGTYTSNYSFGAWVQIVVEFWYLVGILTARWLALSCWRNLRCTGSKPALFLAFLDQWNAANLSYCMRPLLFPGYAAVAVLHSNGCITRWHTGSGTATALSGGSQFHHCQAHSRCSLE